MEEDPVPDREHLAAFYREVFERNRARLGFDPGAVELWLNVIRTGDLARATVERRMRRAGLTGPAFGVMMLLSASREGLAMSEIGARFLVTRANITGLVDTLERRGCVERAAHPADRRVWRVRLTAKGRRKLDGVLPAHFSFIAGLAAGIPTAERRRAVAVLEKVRAALAARGAQA